MRDYLSQPPETRPKADSLEIAFDCRYFLGDRPCSWHKQSGVVCTCDKYEEVEERLLIIKLDAMGDVLRTTALLPPLREVHPRAALTWITRKESVPLLQGNPHIAEVLELGPDAFAHLLVPGRSTGSSTSTRRRSVPRWPRRRNRVAKTASC